MVGRKEGGRRGREEERGRARERMSLGARVTSAGEKNSSRTESPSVRRGRASMPVSVRTHDYETLLIYGTVTVPYPTHKYEAKNGNNTNRDNICRV